MDDDYREYLINMRAAEKIGCAAGERIRDIRSSPPFTQRELGDYLAPSWKTTPSIASGRISEIDSGWLFRHLLKYSSRPPRAGVNRDQVVLKKARFVADYLSALSVPRDVALDIVREIPRIEETFALPVSNVAPYTRSTLFSELHFIGSSNPATFAEIERMVDDSGILSPYK